MTTTTPLADARLIGLAHYAGRAVLEHVLARHGATFQQQITLRAAVTADGPLDLDTLVAGVVAALKVDAESVRATVGELLDRELLAAGEEGIRPTDAGRELLATVGAETAPFSARIYAGIPTEDLAAAGRVLTLVIERAGAELAALTTQA
ncbi:MarR family transcriptional regulator [Streptomyces sp. NPDC002588]|uniref:MarR family transcriptional regulator n=1 Tax=Streptomyces sp. NPDC002588 TaxID=3154419 RepID=UPI0033312D3A